MTMPCSLSFSSSASGGDAMEISFNKLSALGIDELKVKALQEQLHSERLIRLPEVKLRTGLARSTIYLYMSLGTFPKNRKLGMRGVGWVESEIVAWVMSRIEQPH